MSLKLISLVAAAVLVAACATEPEGAGQASGQGSSSSTSGSGSSSGGVGNQQATGNVQTNAPAPGSIEDLVVNVGDRVFFSFNKSDIQPDAAKILDRQAAWLNKFSNHVIVVEGHCDERGTREFNLALGERRANSVREYLISVGVAANRIETISYGKERPAVLGANDASWSQNRRGVTILKNAGS